jgi:O-antigen/teichoic acid export membrane protein
MADNFQRASYDVSKLISVDVVVKVVATLLLAFYARRLDAESFALIPLYEMLGSFSIIVCGLGIPTNLVRCIPAALERSREETQRLTTTGFRLVVGSSVLSSLAIFFLSRPISQLISGSMETEHLVRIMLLGFPAIAAIRVGANILWATSRFGTMAMMQLTRVMGNLICAGLLLIMGLEGLIIGLVLRDWITASATLWSIRDLFLGFTVRAYPARQLIRESAAYYVEGFVMYFRTEGDKWVVASYLGAAPLGIYYIAQRISFILSAVFQATDKVMAIAVLKNRDDKKVVGAMISKLLVMLSQTAIPGIFLVMGLTPAFITILAGEGAYQGATIPAIILLMANLIAFMRQPLGRGVFGLNSPKARLKLSFAESVVLVVALLVLTPLMSTVGVATARVIGGLASTLLAFRIASSKTSIIYPLREIAISLAGSIAMASILLWWQQLFPTFYLLPVGVVMGIVVFLGINLALNRKAFMGTLQMIRPNRKK